MSEYIGEGPKSNGPTREQARRTLVKRLEEATLGRDRFIQLESGSKRSYDHTPSGPEGIEGNYGVMAGDGLVVLDLDWYTEATRPSMIDDLPPTFVVETPHGGEHMYFIVNTRVHNTTLDWGSVRSEGWYCVGPGTDLTSCDKDWHDCSLDDEGRYQINENRPIAELPTSIIEQVRSKRANSNETLPGELSTTTSLEDIDADFDVVNRIRILKRTDVGKKVKNLIEGEYDEAGYGDDRSRAETALCTYLKFALFNDRRVVKEAMDIICRENPNTSAGRRKWLENMYHRKSALSDAYDPDRTMSGWRPWYSLRPDVSNEVRSRVFDVLLLRGPSTSTEIADDKMVQRSQYQVQRALKRYLDEGLVRWWRDGRSVIYEVHPDWLEETGMERPDWWRPSPDM